MVSGRSLLCFFITCACGCGAPVGPAVPARVAVTSTRAVVSGGSVHVTVVYSVGNLSDRTILYVFCGSGLDRHEPVGSWSRVWSRLCNAGGTPGALSILAHTSHVDSAVVDFRRQVGSVTWPNSSLTGEYRVSLVLSTAAFEPLRAEYRMSAAFPLNEP